MMRPQISFHSLPTSSEHIYLNVQDTHAAQKIIEIIVGAPWLFFSNTEPRKWNDLSTLCSCLPPA